MELGIFMVSDKGVFAFGEAEIWEKDANREKSKKIIGFPIDRDRQLGIYLGR